MFDKYYINFKKGLKFFKTLDSVEDVTLSPVLRFHALTENDDIESYDDLYILISKMASEEGLSFEQFFQEIVNSIDNESEDNSSYLKLLTLYDKLHDLKSNNNVFII